MNIAIRKALQVIKTYGLSSFYMDIRQLSTIVDNEGIRLFQFPFHGRLKERYICTQDNIALIYIRDSLNPIEEKHYVAHALGHHFLHRGNHAYISGIVLDKLERQAEDFAAMLLIPPEIFKHTCPTLSFELAEKCEVSLQLAERRMQIYEKYKI